MVLRRKHTGTLYVVTCVHTPGSGKKGEDTVHIDQLKREVEWLMDERHYELVNKFLSTSDKGIKAAAGSRSLFDTKSDRDDVVHLVRLRSSH